MLPTTQLLPLTRAFDTGLRPRRLPHAPATLLPGLLTATRTGLTPASDDELTTKDHLNTVPSSLLVARKRQASASSSSWTASPLPLFPLRVAQPMRPHWSRAAPSSMAATPACCS